jgi:hypothetical protein
MTRPRQPQPSRTHIPIGGDHSGRPLPDPLNPR